MFTQPRARSLNKRIDFRSLAQYRTSMAFWCERIYTQREMEPPHKRLLFNQMTEAMRSIAAKYRVKVLPTTKTHLGIDEIRQMIDYDLVYAVAIINSEQHQVIWCIMRITAIRPSSVGPSSGADEEERLTHCLTWRDADFTKDPDVPGKFDSILRIQFLKTNRDVPEVKDNKVLEFNIRAPNAAVSYTHLTLPTKRIV